MLGIILANIVKVTVEVRVRVRFGFGLSIHDGHEHPSYKSQMDLVSQMDTLD